MFIAFAPFETFIAFATFTLLRIGSGIYIEKVAKATKVTKVSNV